MADGNGGHKYPWEEELDRHAEPEPLWPPPLDLGRLASEDPDPPAFLIQDWLPVGYATLFAGHGGVGKSGIAIYLALAMASGSPFFGLPVAKRRVLYLSCEDRENVLHWRLRRAAAHLGVDLGSLTEDLDILDLVGRETTLWDARQPDSPTPAFATLANRIETSRREVIVVDGVTDTYSGNENDRGQVKRYVNQLVGLIPAETGAVLLIGHVAKPTAGGIQTSEGYSGTTAWHNAVRARWYLYPESGEDGKTGDLALELQKSNLGRADQQMKFSWDDDQKLFCGQSANAMSHFDAIKRDESEFDQIVRCFIECRDAAIMIPAATTGNRTAYHVMSQSEIFPKSLIDSKKAGVRRFWRIIEKLRHTGRVQEAEHRRADRHKSVQLSFLR